MAQRLGRAGARANQAKHAIRRARDVFPRDGTFACRGIARRRHASPGFLRRAGEGLSVSPEATPSFSRSRPCARFACSARAARLQRPGALRCDGVAGSRRQSRLCHPTGVHHHEHTRRHRGRFLAGRAVVVRLHRARAPGARGVAPVSRRADRGAVRGARPLVAQAGRLRARCVAARVCAAAVRAAPGAGAARRGAARGRGLPLRVRRLGLPQAALRGAAARELRGHVPRCAACAAGVRGPVPGHADAGTRARCSSVRCSTTRRP
ncbi:hypothetical protein VVAX_06008 [Variovorax paradoxus]|uniref:Uncharacterized protein n=1 Tax=Variovorax paradoxus TaxID=34073 RepID=A0A679JE64_VARPD|nr:hypothetical protein VVAX_06008 [Variovorax paradoxus]